MIPETTEYENENTDQDLDPEPTTAPLARLDSPQSIVHACWMFGEKSDYVYEFTQNGSTVADLNIDAIRDIATQLGLVIEETTHEETDSDWIVQTKACNPKTGAVSLGIAKEPKATQNGLDNRFAFQSAVAKSQRNVLRQLIPSSIPKMILRHFDVTPSDAVVDIIETETAQQGGRSVHRRDKCP